MKRILLFAIAAGVLLAQSNPFVGTWKLNLDKSKFSGAPAPKSQTATIEAVANGQKNTTEGIAADGGRTTYSYTAMYDSKDYPISGNGAPGGADTIAIKHINANTNESTLKKAGKVVVTTKGTVSKDGKVRTVTRKGTDESGHSINTVSLFDRQ
jgi:hypothetical protein